MKLTVDQARCQGHGRCYAHAPGMFEPFDDHGHATVITEILQSDQIDPARHAVGDCPEQAITLRET